MAAARELFEESGVLLAEPLPAGDLEWARRIESRELTMAQFRGGQGCSLMAGSLHPWSRWITPASEPRRYDTILSSWKRRLASLHARPALRPTVPAGFAIVDLVDGHARTEWFLLPPTLSMLRDLHEAGSALAARHGSHARPQQRV